MNIKEVAKRAKVSTATVSRTINDSEKVRPGTAARVRQAIEELNFYPNTHARTLVSGRSRMLGLIISDITNPFFPELVKSFEDQAVERGQEVIIGNTDYNPKRMAGCIRRMVERKVDGVAIMTSEADPALVMEDEVTIAIQHKGKLRDTLTAPKGASREALEALALASEKVQRSLDGAQVRKVIVVPDRLVNIVT